MNNLSSAEPEVLSASRGPSVGERTKDFVINTQIGFLEKRIYFCRDFTARSRKALAFAAVSIVWAHFSFRNVDPVIHVTMCSIAGLMTVFFIWALVRSLYEEYTYKRQIAKLDASRPYIDV